MPMARGLEKDDIYGSFQTKPFYDFVTVYSFDPILTLQNTSIILFLPAITM